MENEGRKEFERIVAVLTAAEGDVTLGKMMSAPGLKFGNKVFAFQAKEGMGFRLGREFDQNTFGKVDFEPLNPFKTKGPLKGWFTVRSDQRDAWEALAKSALAFTKTLEACPISMRTPRP